LNAVEVFRQRPVARIRLYFSAASARSIQHSKWRRKLLATVLEMGDKLLKSGVTVLASTWSHQLQQSQRAVGHVQVAFIIKLGAQGPAR
jgi:hypothetical protein